MAGYFRETGFHKTAALCERGHVATTMAEDIPVGKRCTECGAPILKACGECGAAIKGDYIVPGVVVVGSGVEYERPMFCDDCGAAFPWAGRRERLYELANLAKQEAGIDEATRLWLQERLAALQAIDAMDDKAQIRAWRELQDHVGVLWENPVTANVIAGLITEGVKAALK